MMLMMRMMKRRRDVCVSLSLSLPMHGKNGLRYGSILSLCIPVFSEEKNAAFSFAAVMEKSPLTPISLPFRVSILSIVLMDVMKTCSLMSICVSITNTLKATILLGASTNINYPSVQQRFQQLSHLQMAWDDYYCCYSCYLAFFRALG